MSGDLNALIEQNISKLMAISVRLRVNVKACKTFARWKIKFSKDLKKKGGTGMNLFWFIISPSASVTLKLYLCLMMLQISLVRDIPAKYLQRHNEHKDRISKYSL